jgi:hypothetical protein
MGTLLTTFIRPIADNQSRISERQVAWGATGPSKAVAPTTEEDIMAKKAKKAKKKARAKK